MWLVVALLYGAGLRGSVWSFQSRTSTSTRMRLNGGGLGVRPPFDRR